MKSSNMARGGIYTALTIVLLYAINMLPTSKLSILCITSAILAFSIVTIGVKNSLIVYFASSILSFLLGANIYAAAYLLFFGLFSFVKYYVERLRKIPLEIVLKLLYCNISFAVIYFLYTTVFLANLQINLSKILIILGAQVFFILYDFALTIIINYINKKFLKI
jgi:hypothetical protein